MAGLRRVVLPPPSLPQLVLVLVLPAAASCCHEPPPGARRLLSCHTQADAALVPIALTCWWAALALCLQPPPLRLLLPLARTLGPSVTPTTVASLSAPACIFFRASMFLLKCSSLAARTT
jgi:hypothetical protein